MPFVVRPLVLVGVDLPAPGQEVVLHREELLVDAGLLVEVQRLDLCATDGLFGLDRGKAEAHVVIPDDTPITARDVTYGGNTEADLVSETMSTGFLTEPESAYCPATLLGSSILGGHRRFPR